MYTIRQPPTIIFGKNSASNFEYPKKSLLITSKGAKSRGWIEKLNLTTYEFFDKVEPNPAMKTVEKILQEFDSNNFTHVIGLGGGSVLDVAKYVGFKLSKKKIMIPTTFGSGSEVTRISVLKINGKKKSFHDDKIIADIAIVDSNFLSGTPIHIIKNSAIDALAQCSEGYDSKIGNSYTQFLCEKAFKILEKALLEKKYEDLPYGALITGLGFGNCSTTLGHALSYVYSNEGISHGHALAYTTTVAHKFNKSKFYFRFKKIIETLSIPKINLKSNLEEAADIIMMDRKHLDNNPIKISKENIIELLRKIQN